MHSRTPWDQGGQVPWAPWAPRLQPRSEKHGKKVLASSLCLPPRYNNEAQRMAHLSYIFLVDHQVCGAEGLRMTEVCLLANLLVCKALESLEEPSYHALCYSLDHDLSFWVGHRLRNGEKKTPKPSLFSSTNRKAPPPVSCTHIHYIDCCKRSGRTARRHSRILTLEY